VTYEDLVARVGEARYRAAVAAARADDWTDDLREVPFDVHDLVEDDLALALRVLGEMPCYANTMTLEPAPALWDFYRAALDGDDERLAATIAYSLWVDFYESAATVEEAWRETTREPAPDARIRRVLAASGPVPYALKAPYFERLGPRWRTEVGAAIERARTEYFGDPGP
jgi:hypothetical protein